MKKAMVGFLLSVCLFVPIAHSKEGTTIREYEDWRYGEYTDRMGAVSYSAVSSAAAGSTTDGESVGVSYLDVTCFLFGAKLQLGFTFDEDFTFDELYTGALLLRPIRVRFDSHDPYLIDVIRLSRTISVRKNHRDFMHQIMQSSSLLIEVHYPNKTVYFDYSLKGAKESLEPILSNCPS